MSFEFDWSSDISWPSGSSTDDFQNPETGGTCRQLLEQEIILPKDALNRVQAARILYQFIKRNKKGYVLNLDSAWGSGKTWFVKRLYLELSKNHPTCYIDAWENDYKGEAIFLVLSKLIDTLNKFTTTRTINKIKESKIAILSKAVAPEIIKAITRVDFEKIINGMEKETSVAPHNKLYTDLLGAATKHLLDDFSREEQAISQLKKEIASLIDGAISNKKQNILSYPLVVFIDELDRCRPSFAIEVLESVKHIFCIPNVFFIISTHSGELQHSINAVYGEKFSSEKYLEKFFDSKFTLSSPRIEDFISLNIATETKELLKDNTHEILSRDENNFKSILSAIAISYEIPLRNMQKALKETNSIIKSLDSRSGILAIPLTCLVIVRREIPKLYLEIIEKFKINSDAKNGYHKDYNLKISSYPSSKHYKTSIKLETKHNFIQEINCLHSDDLSIESSSLLFSIINPLVNPANARDLGYTVHGDLPTIGLADIITLNYSRAHMDKASLNQYIDVIEFGAVFN